MGLSLELVDGTQITWTHMIPLCHAHVLPAKFRFYKIELALRRRLSSGNTARTYTDCGPHSQLDYGRPLLPSLIYNSSEGTLHCATAS
ncbi:hypothetical protein BD309DRAFT_871448 [Dichomitus squalens]|uniref:Uncharacterized protein n=1 Tax=Dichomitus squalens TaxID=114155 RepID=A0A4Q9MHC4_9APHY|nr:uncharacterized protein DICSQDRAFT_151622 [Dichomitus squalens LYAD-421 SS1]EJF67334.1 hypothetical protein DICSQDRAFT_151622 [Dichomitus squalens LYAD-421 SS1]TBU26864.1 hypothetical protein BD311DRAFT_779409 [Dichomitus squalens]TBU39848.1 hypothetical protein BD309DRAFT_871448 [Dichomitus squalens]TBU62491.1 hypothetical protein BD310DRAFT_810872 [Dichomitus squalens]